MTKPQDNTEQQILDAAYDVFMEKGMHGAKMQDIADEAGIKRTVVNYYFRTKEKLYKKVARTIVQHALPKMMGVLNSDMSLEEKIKAFAHNYISMAQKTPFMPVYIVTEVNKLGTEFIVELFDGNLPDIQPFVKHIETEKAAGKIRDIDPYQVILNLISLCLFPFVGRKMFLLMTGVEKKQYNDMIEQRKQEVPRVILASLKPD